MAWRVGFRDSRDAYEYIAVLSRKSESLLLSPEEAFSPTKRKDGTDLLEPWV
jgi:hypothetical protein